MSATLRVSPAVMVGDDLRRANPPRGVAVPRPSCTLEVLRKSVSKAPLRLAQAHPKLVEAVEVALESNRPPHDVDVAAMAVAMLLASSRVADEPEVDDVNETLLGWFEEPELALRALARRAPLVQSKRAMTGYEHADRCGWLALARILGRANDADYARARRVASTMREESKSAAFHHAVAMAFPSEPWATQDARAYIGKKSDVELRWYLKVSMLLSATQDLRVARPLFQAMLADSAAVGSTSAPALALAYRFGGEIQDELIASLLANLKARGTYGPHDRESNLIARALAWIGTPEVATVLADRVGKQVGGEAAAAFFERFPGIRSATAETRPRAAGVGQVAIAGDFEIFGETPDGWRQSRIEPTQFSDWGELASPTANRQVGDILDEWAGRISVEVSSHMGRARTDRGGGVSLRGVVDEPTFRAHIAELIAAFRFGPEQAARRRTEITGVLLACVLGTSQGVRFEASEGGESSVEHLDDSIESDESIREAVTAAKNGRARKTRSGSGPKRAVKRPSARRR